ncbi:MAG: hypothetical protein ACT4PJ_08165 [Gemmatimonadaceae bacterium]
MRKEKLVELRAEPGRPPPSWRSWLESNWPDVRIVDAIRAHGQATRAFPGIQLRASPTGERLLLPRTAIAQQTVPTRLGELRAENNAAVARLAGQLALHARSEEELLYPMALLVGDLVRARLAARRPDRR